MAGKTDISVGFISLGCAKNLVDSEIMATRLFSAGIKLAPSPEDADVVLVNTCAFISDARDESAAYINYACDLKKQGKCRAVVVTGCMPQRYREDLFDVFPEIDALVGVDELDDIPVIIKQAVSRTSCFCNVSKKSTAVINPPDPRILFTGGPYAYVKIAEGCNHRCAFCAIPLIRGNYRSRTLDSVVRESESLLENGVKELNFISQDTMSYGSDRQNGGNLASLVRAVAGIGGKFRIRLLYGHPMHVTDELLDVMGGTEQVCRYLDIPVQHADDEILKRMGRKGSRVEYLDVVQRIRKRLPGVTLRTTCLVGFPGETEKRFAELAGFVKDARFDRLGVFTYSKEEGTRAFAMKETVSKKSKEQRRDDLLQIQSEIIDLNAARRVGKTEELLVDRLIPGNGLAGRSCGEAPEVDGEIIVEKNANGIKPGDFIPVRMVQQSGFDMTADFAR